MRLGGNSARPLAALLTALLVVSAAPRSEAAEHAREAAKREAVVLVFGRQLLERRLAAFLPVQPGRFLPASSLQRACLNPAVRPDSLLLYFPDSNRCETLARFDAFQLRQRLRAITGHAPPPDLERQLREAPAVALAASPALTTRPARAAAKCACAANTAPVGAVGCELQGASAGAPIAPIEFLAVDEEGDPLTGEFSFERDVDPAQQGLPAPLASTCETDVGQLHCTVSGKAPDLPGALLLTLAVSDGAANVALVAQLDVAPAPAGQVFRDGFETPTCP